jgi:predicted phage tail protein
MAPNDGNRGPRLRFVPFFPFLFLSAVFVGGHGALTIALSLIASALLTVGISSMIARRQRRRHERILQRYEGSESR